MKNILYILITSVLITPLHSNIWEEVSTPFDYIPVFNLTSINDEVYVSKFDRDLGTNGYYVNYIHQENEWVKAKDDTIYELFGKPNIIRQHENKILVSCQSGFYLSEDSAKTWIKIKNPYNSGPQVQDINVSENGVFVISSFFPYPMLKYDKLKDEWKQINDIRSDTSLNLIVQKIESNSTHLFALQQIMVSPFISNDTLEGGLYISNDNGESWSKTLIDSALYSVYSNDEIVLACTKFGYLLRSEDNGITWSVENIGTVFLNYFDDGERLLVSSNPLGIIESRDKGKTWKVLNKAISSSQIYKKDGKYFFMGFLNLVYETDESFKVIKKTNLITYNTFLYDICSTNDTIFATGSFKRGIQFSTNAGDSWELYSSYLEERGETITFIRKKDNQIYCKVPYQLYSSNDYGRTFEVSSFGSYSDLLILDDKILVYGKDGIRISNDNGKTFTLVDTSNIKKDYLIFKIVKTTNGDLLAFSQFDGVFKSTDNAETWTQLVDSLPTGVSYSSVYDFFEFDSNYYAFNSTPALLFKSTDKGKSWSKIEIELFDKIENCYVYMIDENNIILSSYGNGLKGLRITNDQGKTWRRIDDDLPKIDGNNNIDYRIIGNVNNNIFLSHFVSSEGGGLHRTTLSKLGIPTSVETELNYLYTLPPYPLPAKSEVKVQFYWDINLPMTVDDISIYDLSGREVQTKDKLRIDKQASHYGNLIWDCSEAQPGIYIINISHGTEERAVKVVVE